MSYRLGVDVGGTFTDFLLTGPDGLRVVHKTSSTPDDPSSGVVQGLEGIATELGIGLRELVRRLEVIVHGTTVTTNALLTRRGAKTGLLTTKGFRDVVAMRDGTREEPYDNRLRPPVPLVPRYLSVGVGGRLDHDGDEVDALEAEDVRAAAALFASEGVEAVAIAFLHSPANPSHEQRAAELVRERLPDVYLTTSSELLPQIRYYPRASTAVLNSYAGPIVTRYLDALGRRLAELEFSGVLLIMQSNGGVATPGEVSQRAALSLLSGPASGPTAGAFSLEPHGISDCITVDMGGTSFDAALVKNGEPLVMTDGVVSRWRLALPMIDIHTIGAGGGSIARVDEGGLLHVGPQSAGAQPGPACYGRGGTEATTTDADLVLGFLAESSFLHGQMSLDRDAATQAIATRIAAPLGLGLEAAAAGIYDVVNVNMAAGVREVSVRRGYDPRDFPLVVAGGAGPVHAAAIARELEIPLIVIPRESSIFCAAGMLICDFKHDLVQAHKQLLGDLDAGELGELLGALSARGRTTLERELVPPERIRLRASLDLRYVGQWHELTLAITDEPGTRVDLRRVEALFHEQHDALFGHHSEGMPVEMLAARVTAIGEVTKPSVAPLDGGASPERALRTTRDVWWPLERASVATAVFEGGELAAGSRLKGPAIVELEHTTAVVPSDFALGVDRFGSFVLFHGERGRELAAQLLGGRDQVAA